MRISHARIYTMCGPVIEDGFVEFENGRITAVGQGADGGYDAGGACLFPGLIDAHCHLGVCLDKPYGGAAALDWENVHFERAFRAGITTVVTGPGSQSPVGGTFLAVQTRWENEAQRILKDPVALKIAFGENTHRTTKENLAAIEAALPQYPSLPLKAHCHKVEDIAAALTLAQKHRRPITIEHCTEGQDVLPQLQRAALGVCAGPLITDINKAELLRLDPGLPGELARQGICTAIVTDHPETPVEYLPLCAALACAKGMAEGDALAAITIGAAKNCGLDGLIGTIEVGKLANLALFDKPPVQLAARCLAVVINNRLCIL